MQTRNIDCIVSSEYATAIDGATLASGSGYSNGGETDSGSFSLLDVVYCCMDDTASNHDPAAIEAASCTYPDAGDECTGDCLVDSPADCAGTYV